jgi:serine protease
VSAAALAASALLAAAPAGAQTPETATHAAHVMAAHQAAAAASGNLSYGGGPIVTSPTIYIVYWGSQWGTSTITNDPSGLAPLQLSFFQHAYGSGDTWSNSVTQ